MHGAELVLALAAAVPGFAGALGLSASALQQLVLRWRRPASGRHMLLTSGASDQAPAIFAERSEAAGPELWTQRNFPPWCRHGSMNPKPCQAYVMLVVQMEGLVISCRNLFLLKWSQDEAARSRIAPSGWLKCNSLRCSRWDQWILTLLAGFEQPAKKEASNLLVAALQKVFLP